MMRIQLKTEVAVHNILANIAGLARLLQSRLESFINLKDFSVNIIVSTGSANCKSSDSHPFNNNMRVMHQNFTILAGSRLAFVRVANQKLVARKLPWHEAPFEASRETRAATATQA
ncbi:hypothetical protein ADJ79_09595 [Ottowia sp. oral taxon 894]|nr:hypothetical protein ADJ79_09595 [Ottowia sp. oral taxon 894]